MSFMCKPCCAKAGINTASIFTRSRGRCEDCAKIDNCYDVPKEVYRGYSEMNTESSKKKVKAELVYMQDGRKIVVDKLGRSTDLAKVPVTIEAFDAAIDYVMGDNFKLVKEHVKGRTRYQEMAVFKIFTEELERSSDTDMLISIHIIRAAILRLQENGIYVWDEV